MQLSGHIRPSEESAESAADGAPDPARGRPQERFTSLMHHIYQVKRGDYAVLTPPATGDELERKIREKLAQFAGYLPAGDATVEDATVKEPT